MTLADDVEAFVVILYILAAIGALCVLCTAVLVAVVVARVTADRAREARMGSRAVDEELREMTGDGSGKAS